MRSKDIIMLMRAQIFSCLIMAAAVIGAAFWTPAAEVRDEPAPIDFSSLNSQASSALETLRTAQESRLALLQTAEF
jgi:hypothetical protein